MIGLAIYFLINIVMFSMGERGEGSGGGNLGSLGTFWLRLEILLVVTTGVRAEMLLNILQCTQQPSQPPPSTTPATENDPTQMSIVNSGQAEKLCSPMSPTKDIVK